MANRGLRTANKLHRGCLLFGYKRAQWHVHAQPVAASMRLLPDTRNDERAVARLARFSVQLTRKVGELETRHAASSAHNK